MTWKSDNEWSRRDRDYDSRSRSSSSTEIIIGALVFGVFICIFIVFAIYQCCKKASKKAAKVDRAYYNKNGNSHKEGTMPPQPSYMPSHPPPGILHSQKSQPLTSSGSRHQTHQQPYPPPQLPATASGHSNAPYPLPMPSSPMSAAASYPPSASPYPPAAPLPMMPAGVTDQQHISPYPPLPAENAYPPISPYPPAEEAADTRRDGTRRQSNPRPSQQFWLAAAQCHHRWHRQFLLQLGAEVPVMPKSICNLQSSIRRRHPPNTPAGRCAAIGTATKGGDGSSNDNYMSATERERRRSADKRKKH